MNSGAPEREYVLARRVLLDALDALGNHRNACVLVGAQAVYAHTGPSDIAVPEHTTDADLAIDPRILEASPLLGPTLMAAGFRASGRPGTWLGDEDVAVDLMVPATLGGGGRRGARIPPHDQDVARKAKGLEAAVEDWALHRVPSLEPERDQRTHIVRVAGPAALLVAKLHKIADRVGDADRSRDKDALDVLRLLQTIPTDALAGSLRQLLSADVCASVVAEAIGHLEQLFATDQPAGAEMAVRASGALADAATIRASCAILAGELLEAVRRAD